MSESLVPIPTSDDFRKCYGCGPDNHAGLRLVFAREPGPDGAPGRVVATWSPPETTGGYGRIVHGGVVATLLDEAMGWALWGLTGSLGMTRELTVRYRRPVIVGRQVTIDGRVAARDERGATVEARVLDVRGRVAAEGTGQFTFVSADRVRDDA